MHRSIVYRALVTAAVLALGAAAPGAAQGTYRRVSSSDDGTGVTVRSEALARGGYAVVVDLDANRLYFARGREVLWSAPVGTGTGLRMESDRDAWDFHTPRGSFHVVYKEREPDWIAPDWYFVEHGLPVPGPNDPKRHFVRGLGAAAVYIGQGLAIHGTDHPELLGQRVSHGCIRLSDANALRLYHDVQVGTEVVIVGGSREAVRAPAGARSSRPEGTPPPRDPFVVELEHQPTAQLLSRLDDELVADSFSEGTARWPSVASVLLFRGVRDGDDDALDGLLRRVGDLGEGRVRTEYAAVVADAFSQGPLRALEVLGRMDRGTRAEVAGAMVRASIALYPGDDNDVAAPWPTGRVPRAVLDDGASRRGWDALKAAEDDYRGSADARSRTVEL